MEHQIVSKRSFWDLFGHTMDQGTLARLTSEHGSVYWQVFSWLPVPNHRIEGGLDLFGLVWIGLDWFGLVWIGLDWFGFVVSQKVALFGFPRAVHLTPNNRGLVWFGHQGPGNKRLTSWDLDKTWTKTGTTNLAVLRFPAKSE